MAFFVKVICAINSNESLRDLAKFLIGGYTVFNNKEIFKKEFVSTAQAMWGKELNELTKNEIYQSFVRVIRLAISQNWIKSNKYYQDYQEKQVYYFSIEFLLGRLLNCNLINMDLRKVCVEAFSELNIELPEILCEEPDAGLGNGGLGRLAACFIDSMAALGLPGHGCGIRYRYGLFEQKIMNNYQVELPDNWLKDGFAWEFRKADKSVDVKFGGNAYMAKTMIGLKCIHENYNIVHAVPYDVPVVGYKNNTVNTLRLWSAEFTSDFNYKDLSYEEYKEKMRQKHAVQRITKILYPDDSSYEGRLLRLVQEYFFVSAGVQSIVRRYKKLGLSMYNFSDKIAIHINDTHPAMAIAELMRIFIDEEGLGWDESWEITVKTMAYTNHTIMPEALEKWPIDMFKNLLPRIYMIIEEINRRLTATVWERYHDDAKVREMAILWEDNVHMARLAVVGSHSVNGVAKIHSDILKQHTMSVFNDYYKGKFNNKTNGITHRRWLIAANPELTLLLDKSISTKWHRNPERLIELLKYANDKSFKQELDLIKTKRKEILAKFILSTNDIVIDPSSIFDVQVKRIHSYKRQIMNILHIMDIYNQLKENPQLEMVPRTFIFGGKAAPGYYIAKQTIKLINCMANMVNNDKTINDKVKIVFLENYGVSLGELVFPAANVSEQISTASKEASGTGNMKFMMNGAITLGTLDGANVEIAQAVGQEHCVIFGLRAEEVIAYQNNGNYSSWDIYNNDNRVKTVLEQLVNGYFQDGGEEFRPLYDYLLYNNDEFFVLKDFAAYAKAQRQIERLYKNKQDWLTSSTVNIAHSGMFSSDRTIEEYAKDIWHIRPALIP